MSKKRQNFKLWAGDTRDIIFNTTGFDNFDNLDLEWHMARTRNSTAEITKLSGSGITVDGKVVTVEVTGTDTGDLKGNYAHQLKAVDVGGDYTTLAEGMVRVIPTI